MSLYRNPEEHAANPPSTWTVQKKGTRLWSVVDQNGTVLDTLSRKRDAELALSEGFLVHLWNKETDWYAGRDVPGWRPYKKEAA